MERRQNDQEARRTWRVEGRQGKARQETRIKERQKRKKEQMGIEN